MKLIDDASLAQLWKTSISTKGSIFPRAVKFQILWRKTRKEKKNKNGFEKEKLLSFLESHEGTMSVPII